MFSIPLLYNHENSYYITSNRLSLKKLINYSIFPQLVFTSILGIIIGIIYWQLDTEPNSFNDRLTLCVIFVAVESRTPGEHQKIINTFFIIKQLVLFVAGQQNSTQSHGTLVAVLPTHFRFQI